MNAFRDNPELIGAAILAGAALLFILSRRARGTSSQGKSGGDGGASYAASDTGSSGDCGGDGGGDGGD